MGRIEDLAERRRRMQARRAGQDGGAARPETEPPEGQTPDEPPEPEPQTETEPEGQMTLPGPTSDPTEEPA